MIIHTPPLTIQLLKILLGFSIAKQSTLLTLQFRACLDGYSCQIAMEAWMNFANHIQDYYNDAFARAIYGR